MEYCLQSNLSFSSPREHTKLHSTICYTKFDDNS